MVAIVRFLLLSCCVVVGLSTPATAEPALPANADALVEDGIAAYDAEDYQRAKDILLPLAEAGHGKAMNMIGLMHDGTPVFSADPKAECDWYERSAISGYNSGMYNLSICYNHGDGRPKNQKVMLYWRNKAANAGHIPAMLNLSSLDTSKGAEYLKWHRLAIKHGSTYAKVSLWLDGYRDEVPDITLQEIICVSWNILLSKGNFESCD